MSRHCLCKLVCVCLCLISVNLFGDVNTTSIRDPAALIGNEIARLDTLIQATQQSLEGQKTLREKIVEYKKIQDLYLQQPQNNDLLFRLVKSAKRTLDTIKENSLTQTFDPEFINELTVLSQAANKRGVPKP